MRVSFTIAVIFVFTIVMAPAAQAPRATFKVNTTEDKKDVSPGDGICATNTGECSLRAALMENNALGGGNVIELKAKTYTLTKNADDETGGDLDSTAPVDIIGLGTDVTIIDAAGLSTPDRVLHVNAPSGLTTISGVTFQNGHQTNGGGIFLESDADLTGVMLANNSAEEGGGLSCFSCGYLTVHNLVVKNNTAGLAGGGLYIFEAEVDALNLTVNGNIATTAFGGGAVFFESDIYLADSSITKNSAGQDGGGAYINTSTFATENLLVSHNTSGNFGGGLRIDTAVYALQTTLVSSNTTSGYGGGVAITDSTGLTAKTSLIHNIAAMGGGAAYVGNTAFLVSNSTISGNQGAEGGAVFFSQGPSSNYDSVFSNVTIVENTLMPVNTGESGGIDATFLGLGSLTLNNTILTANDALQCIGTLDSGDGNIFANTTDCTINTQSGDDTAILDPLLAPLSIDSGTGYAAVHVPQPGSPAINGGANANCREEDQRNVSRPHDAGDPCDVGAVEGASLSLLANGSLEDADADGTPDGWSFKTPSADVLKCSTVDSKPAVVGQCAIKFKDATGKLKQTVMFPAPLDGVFYLGAFIDAKKVFDGAIKAKFYDGAGNQLFKGQIDVLAATNGYTALSGETPIGIGVASVKFIVAYPVDGGKMFVDGLWLTINPNPLRMSRAPLPVPPVPSGFRGGN